MAATETVGVSAKAALALAGSPRLGRLHDELVGRADACAVGVYVADSPRTGSPAVFWDFGAADVYLIASAPVEGDGPGGVYASRADGVRYGAWGEVEAVPAVLSLLALPGTGIVPVREGDWAMLGRHADKFVRRAVAAHAGAPVGVRVAAALA